MKTIIAIIAALIVLGIVVLTHTEIGRVDSQGFGDEELHRL